MDYYSREELEELLGEVGENVQINRSAIFFNSKKIFLGSFVRIDCFCILSAGNKGIYLKDHVHLAPCVHMMGGGGRIFLDHFSAISTRVSFFTSSDDYVDGYMTNPLIPIQYRKLQSGSITLHRHSLIGSGSIILPGVEIRFGGSIGALSLVKKSVEECELVAGIPARKIGMRNRSQLIEMEKKFIANEETRLRYDSCGNLKIKSELLVDCKN